MKREAHHEDKNMTQNYTRALNGFIIKDFPMDKPDGRHWFIKDKGKKYAIFAFKYDKQQFKKKHGDLIRRGITMPTAVKILEDVAGEVSNELARLGGNTAYMIFDQPRASVCT